MVKGVTNPTEILRAGLRLPPLWDFTWTHRVSHDSDWTRRLRLGTYPGSRTKLDTGGVQRHRPFRPCVALTRLVNARLAFLLVSEDNLLSLPSLHPAQQSPDEPGTRKLRGTSPHAHLKLEPEEDSFLLVVQKLEPFAF